jgi:hypothetical protein
MDAYIVSELFIFIQRKVVLVRKSTQVFLDAVESILHVLFARSVPYRSATSTKGVVRPSLRGSVEHAATHECFGDNRGVREPGPLILAGHPGLQAHGVRRCTAWPARLFTGAGHDRQRPAALRFQQWTMLLPWSGSQRPLRMTRSAARAARLAAGESPSPKANDSPPMPIRTACGARP